MKRVNMGTTLILVCKCLSGSLIGKVPWLYPRFLIGFMFFFHDGFLNWQKTYPLKERKPNATPWNLVVLSKRTMTWPWIKWRISQYIHNVGFVFVVFPRNQECYDICCCSCWMRFFFKRHYCQQLKRHHIRLMLRPCVPPAVDLEADTSLMFDASTFDILTVSDGSPSTRAVPTAQSHHVTSSHRIVLQNIPVHCTACRRTGEFVPLYIYIYIMLYPD